MVWHPYLDFETASTVATTLVHSKRSSLTSFRLNNTRRSTKRFFGRRGSAERVLPCNSKVMGSTPPMPLRSSPEQVVCCLSLSHTSDSFIKEWQLAHNKLALKTFLFLNQRRSCINRIKPQQEAHQLVGQAKRRATKKSTRSRGDIFKFFLRVNSQPDGHVISGVAAE